ncbi:MAG: hypothetical protein JNJ52_12740 [Flavobacterium sp.]|nr:hypothetical protein [Flavobacterium sp.]
MELNNIEKQIKEKLQSREIKPSEMAWDRLDAMLSVAEEKKTKRSFGWLYIAASILVLLTAGTFFFTQKNTEISPDNAVVDQEVTKDSVLTSQPQIKENTVPNKKMQPLVQVEKSTSQPTTDNQQPTAKNKVSIIKSNQSIAHQSTTIQNNQSVNQSQKEEVIAEKQGQNNLNSNLPVIEKTIPIENKEVIAQNESKATTFSKVTVSANSLLSQVDGELDLTFREKVFKKVAKNYKEVKVAVANRNNVK